ncbi:hypothetical protein PV05_03517 [Exophiala xenobiotica]|uniref:Uncharacterized protein n=1 Tax=Exophiala xenobiotica TaxID=348802 RepID=A0A0D2ETM3_9EURO|nr:uncharacterized protein PV05_03517 [Exophiala xenobiotica]KIW59033.1 hypothetical protein PV05_03517 [Exophiala xenobiotica]
MSSDALNKPETEVERLRTEYLDAVEENRAAHQRYEQALAATGDQPRHTKAEDRTDGVDSTTLLERHIELLRLQKQNASLVVSRDELEQLKFKREATKLEFLPTTVEEFDARFEAGQEVPVLEESITRRVKALESEVVRAHHEAGQERAKLEKAKMQTQTRVANSSPNRRLHAILATRQELTTWLEESLEKCQDQQQGELEQIECGRRVTEAMIEGQYQRYLDARKRLIAAVTELRAALPEKSTPKLSSSEWQTEQKTTRHQRSREAAALLNTIEKIVLPKVQNQSVSQAHLVFAGEQLQNELGRTINMLERLGDESQLLQAFPILARSGRFGHAASTFGKQVNAQEAQSKDEISRRMEAWLFAAEAADVAGSSIMEKQLDQGRDATDSVSRSLAELKLLKETNSDDNFML